MKKLLCVLLLTALVLSLAACGDKTAEQKDAQPVNTGDASEAQEIVPGENGWKSIGEDEPFGKYRSVEELLAILESGEGFDDARVPSGDEREPVELSGEDDESADPYSGSTNTVTFSDEGWEEPSVDFAEIDMGDEEGGEPDAELPTGGNWSDSTYTAGLPQPPGTLGMVVEEDGVFTAMVTLSSENDYDAYIQSVKSAGFDKDIEEEDLSDYGMDMHSFSASHADGRQLTLTLTGASLIIEISN